MPRRRSRPAPQPARGALPEALLDPKCYGPGVSAVRLVETHISWVFLTGRYAYKVKKPLKLPFVDFSTLQLRRRYCAEEVRVNRRLAADLYLGVVPIGGTSAAPRVGRTPAFEYAVKMREFPADARLDRQLEAGRVSRDVLIEFATRLASFHAGLPAVRGIATEDIGPAALRNLAELAEHLDAERRAELVPLHAWTKRQSILLAETFTRRAANGAHRECHGDLHLQNLLLRNGTIMAFDALEFDRRLRDIDVISETAFLAMDLAAHGRNDLAYEFLNAYLEAGGDYAGCDVLRFYLVYRALVRAKVAAIKETQGASDGHDAERYLATALELDKPRTPLLVITHGFSGSGKTSVTSALIGELPAIRVRSDVERKRLHGLSAAARTGSAVGEGLYDAAASRRTYDTLATIADRLLRSRQTAIVDAAFLRRNERLMFSQVAAANAARFVILDCTASPAELRRRILARAEEGKDASEAGLAVLKQQLATHEPLYPAEQRHTVTVDTEGPLRVAQLAARLRTA